VIDPAALQMMLGMITGRLNRRERGAIAYLIEENRLLRLCSANISRALTRFLADGCRRDSDRTREKRCARSIPLLGRAENHAARS
jgi:hypothetical protein